MSRFNFSFSIYLNIFLNKADAHLNILSMLYKIISFSKAILKMYDVLYVCQSCKLREFSSVEWILVWHRLGTDSVCSYNYHLCKVIQILPTNEGVRGIWKVLVYRLDVYKYCLPLHLVSISYAKLCSKFYKCNYKTQNINSGKDL